MNHPFKQKGPNLLVWVPDLITIDGTPLKNNQNMIGQVLHDCHVPWPNRDMISIFKKGEWIIMGATREKAGIMGRKYVGVEVTEVLGALDETQVEIIVGSPDYKSLTKKEDSSVKSDL